MSKFRKKPVEVDAFHMTSEARADPSTWPDWLTQAHAKEPGVLGAIWPSDYPEIAGDLNLSIGSKTGTLIAGPEYWIIQGVTGELYPVAPDAFAATYDAVEAQP